MAENPYQPPADVLDDSGSTLEPHQWKCLVIGTVVALLLAAVVYWGHWAWLMSTETFPGISGWEAQASEKTSADDPWIIAGIERLDRRYTLPIAVLVFCSVFGASVSIGLLPRGSSLWAAAGFLWPLVSAFACGLLPLIPPIGMLIAMSQLFVAAFLRKDRVVAFAGVSLVLNFGTYVLASFYFDDWFSVFGD